jgi:predicted phosphodiesterase
MNDSSPRLEALLTVGTDGASVEVQRKRQKHPAGWVPGVTLGSEFGTLVTEPLAEAPSDWDKILRELLPEGIDPTEFAIDGTSVEVRAWDGNIGNGELKRFYYFKARIKRRRADIAGRDLEDIVKAAKSAKPKPVRQQDNERTYFIQITDLQAGQADGDGVEGMVARALQLGQLAQADIERLRKAGTPATSIFIPITGDLVEGISGWYEMQTFSVALDRRDQVKLVRRVLTEILIHVSSLGLPVHVAVVPGNHGENRQNGKAYTTLGDNDDVAVVEQIAEAFALSDKFEHVTFSFPAKDRLSLTVEVQGWIVGLTHGHIARSTGSPAQKLTNWFKNMSATRDPIGDADILFVGHYHHFIAQSLIGDTYLVMGGALCDASAWFSQTAGLVSDPLVVKGTITATQPLETLIPHRWPRTKVEARTIGE